MKKSILSFVLISFSIIGTYSQENDPNNFEYAYTNSFTPVSPQVAALSKYVDIPVTYFHGIPNIQIPIYEIDVNGFKLPISLSYHSSGVKVAETSSEVGLGWVLNAGGFIKRTIKGKPDDGFMENPVSPSPDTDLDIFNYQVLDEIGKFIINPNEKVLQIPKKNVSIQYRKDTMTYYFPDRDVYKEFVITDKLGNKFIFSHLEYTSSVSHFAKYFNSRTGVLNWLSGSWKIPNRYSDWQWCNDKWSQLASVSSWSLSKIVLSNHSDSIMFFYNQVTEYNVNLVNESNIIEYDSINRTGQNVVTYTNYLKTIQWSNGKIEFQYLHPRNDIVNRAFDFVFKPDIPSGICYSLSHITIFDGNNNENCTYRLYQSLYNEDPAFPTLIDPKFEFTNHRLRLDSVVCVYPDNKRQSYNLTYNAIPLPNRWSPQVDYWGYYCKNNAINFRPALYKYPDTEPLSFKYPNRLSVYPRPEAINSPVYPDDSRGFDRMPDTVNNQAGILTSIAYPNGTCEHFYYETNQFIECGVEHLGGGLRVKQIDVEDLHQGMITRSRKFSYKNFDTPQICSGLIDKYPVFAAKSYNIINMIAPINPGIVGYTEVAEFDNNNGYYVRNYSYPAAFYTEKTDPVDNDVYLYNIPHDFISNTQFYNQYNKYEILQLIGYPLPDYSFCQGLIIREKIYNTSKLLLKQSDYQYNENNSQEARYEIIHRYPTYYDFFPYNVSALLDEVSLFKYLKRTITRTFPLIKGIPGLTPVVDTVEYYYDNPNHLQMTRKIVKSNGKSRVSWFRYPIDLHIDEYPYNIFDDFDETSHILRKMYLNHIELPLEEYQSTGNSFSAKQNHYIFGEQGFQLGKVSGMNVTTVPTPAYLEITSIPPLGKKVRYKSDIRYKDQFYFDRYDTHGHLLQYHKTDDYTGSIIWDELSGKPLAMAKNATYDDIYCESFENTSATSPWYYNTWGTSPDWVAMLTSAYFWTGEKGLLLNSSTAQQKLFVQIPAGKLTAGKEYTVTARARIIQANASNLPCVKLNAGSSYPYSPLLNVSGWQTVQVKITIPSGNTALTIYLRNYSNDNSSSTSKVVFDEIRLMPSESQMITYTYKPLVGVTSICDANNFVTHYEYDGQGRLIGVRDMDGNILARHYYHYKGELDVSPRMVFFTREGGNSHVLVSGTFSLESSPAWLSCTVVPGGIDLSCFYSEEPQSGSIIVKSGEVYDTIWVSQAYGNDLKLSSLYFEATNTAAQRNLTLTCNSNWEIINPAEWITPSQTRGNSIANITLNIAANLLFTGRTANLTVRHSVGGDVLEKIVRVVQTGVPQSINYPAIADVTSAAGTKTLSITTNVGLGISKKAAWLSLNTTNMAPGTANLIVTHQANAVTISRQDTIFLTPQAGDPTNKYIIFQQAAAAPVLTTDKTSVTIPLAGGSALVSVSSNITWTATVTSGADWITLSPLNSTGSGILSISAPYSKTNHLGTVQLSGSGVSTITISVSQ